jgi:DNA-binding response OmpR family regulator
MARSVLLEGVRILLVEDDVDLREALAAALTSYGADVAQGGCADEARDHLGDHPFDLMVSDINMPGEDGYALLASVRRLPDALHALPAVAMTGRIDRHTACRAAEVGFGRVLAKPFEPAELVEAVRALLPHS